MSVAENTVTAEGLRRGPRKKERPALANRVVDRRSVDGTVLSQVDLEPTIFGIVPNEAVLHQVVTAQLAAGRSGTQSTKTRSEVRGGGAKPFRQKGTGRARAGSSRSPIWSGGGVALGPKPRSYRQRTPKKMVRLALYSALSDRAASDRIALVDSWSWDAPKTKDAVAALSALGLSGRILVVLDRDEQIAGRSFANLPEVQLVLPGELSPYDILRSDWVVFSDRTLPAGDRLVVIEEIIEVVDETTGEVVLEDVVDIIDLDTGDEIVVVTELGSETDDENPADENQEAN
jgi:large subunit ribosomal protein L4